jgi:hypothetical protein
MFIPRITAFGIGLGALATAGGLAVSMTQPKGGEHVFEPLNLLAGGGALLGFGTALGFGLGSPMRGMRPVLTAVAALAGAAALGAGIGPLFTPHAATPQR